MPIPEGGQFFMKGLITGHFKLMAIIFGCIYVLVAALVIIFGAYEGLIFLGIFTVAIAIFVGIFYGAYRMIFKQVIDNIPDIPQLSNPELLKKGQPAQAKILAVEDTGMTINEIYPAIKLTLEVYPPNGVPYQVTINQLIERMQIPLFQPGKMVPVVIDPDNREEVHAFSPGGGGDINGGMGVTAAGGMLPQDAEKMLVENDQVNREIMARGESARATIVEAKDLGIRVNGDNPVMRFLLEVRPSDREQFQAETTAPILASSVPKYSEGKTIFVRYDPEDTTRVAISHS
jgi:hypothetical protein